MATIAQKPLFGWEQIEALGDPRRLRLVLENLPDEPLVRKLKQERDRGRDEDPVRPMWNVLIGRLPVLQRGRKLPAQASYPHIGKLGKQPELSVSTSQDLGRLFGMDLTRIGPTLDFRSDPR